MPPHWTIVISSGLIPFQSPLKLVGGHLNFHFLSLTLASDRRSCPGTISLTGTSHWSHQRIAIVTGESNNLIVVRALANLGTIARCFQLATSNNCSKHQVVTTY